MAINVKIQGNFLVLTDTATSQEVFRYPKEYSRFTKKVTVRDPEDDFVYYTFHAIKYPLGYWKDSSVDGKEFNDFIDDTTGSAFASVNEMDEFLCDNIGGKQITPA